MELTKNKINSELDKHPKKRLNIVTSETQVNLGFISQCQCNHSTIVLKGHCQVHDKDWEARVDAIYIQELIKRVEALEKRIDKND